MGFSPVEAGFSHGICGVVHEAAHHAFGVLSENPQAPGRGKLKVLGFPGFA